MQYQTCRKKKIHIFIIYPSTIHIPEGLFLIIHQSATICATVNDKQLKTLWRYRCTYIPITKQKQTHICAHSYQWQTMTNMPIITLRRQSNSPLCQSDKSLSSSTASTASVSNAHVTHSHSLSGALIQSGPNLITNVSSKHSRGSKT